MLTIHMNIVWHYAPWAYLPAMVESGALTGSNAGAPGETAMLWFSANQRWEPTATKAVRNNAGKIFSLSFKQQVESLGCIRFGLDGSDARLLDWKAACALAGTPREMRRGMEQVGRKKGANPAHWFATAVDIPIAEMHFQVWTGSWLDAEPKEMAAAWIKTKSA